MYSNPVYQATLKRYQNLREDYVKARSISDTETMREIETVGKKVKSTLDWMETLLKEKTNEPLNEFGKEVAEIEAIFAS